MSRDKEFEGLIQEIGKETIDLLIRKNRDYGNSFEELFNKFGMKAPLIRFYDKVGRAERLISSGEQFVKDESLEDTIKDLCGYALLTLAVMRKREKLEECKKHEVL